MKIPFFKPSITDAEINAVIKQMKTGWLTFGEKTQQFEEEFAQYIGAPYVVMLDNATAAIHLACEYTFRKVMRENRKQITVRVPSLTCAATALSPIHAGLNVELVDIVDGDDFIIPDKKTRWSIPVSYAGKYCGAIGTVVEDFAHRIARKCFTGKLQAYSFYVTKNITTSEGGAIACATKEQANWFRQARLFGDDKAIFEREKMYASGKKFWWFQSEFLGWKANPTDLLAVIGIEQLHRIDEMNAERLRIASRYNEAFGLTNDRSPWHLYPMLIKKRDKFMYFMKDKEISCSVHFPPLHMMKAFKPFIVKQLPNTEKVYKHIVSLPLYPYLTVKEQDYVIKSVLEWKKQYA